MSNEQLVWSQKDDFSSISSLTLISLTTGIDISEKMDKTCGKHWIHVKPFCSLCVTPAECWSWGERSHVRQEGHPTEARLCSQEPSEGIQTGSRGGFMAQACMRRGDSSQRAAAQGLKTRAVAWDWLLPQALSAPARAHPGRPGAGGPGPGR